MKREINEEFLDVWAHYMGEKIDAANKKMNLYDVADMKYSYLRGYTEGISSCLAMITMFESGRFSKDYNRIMAIFKEEQNDDKL